MGKPHILVLPFPAQGHVNPLMNISRHLAKRGFKITFVNSDFNHNRVMQTLSNKINGYNGDVAVAAAAANDKIDKMIRMVSMPDGLGPEEDRYNVIKLCLATLHDMPIKLEELIDSVNELERQNNGNKITCLLVDAHIGWALEVARKMGIKGAVVWPASASLLALQMCIPELIDDGVIDRDTGIPIKEQMYEFSSNMPAIDTKNLQWSCFLDSETNKTIFICIRIYLDCLDMTDWWLCNTTYEYEQEAFSLVPKLKPIGPVLMVDAHNNIGNAGAQLWPEDSTCLNWLDDQPTNSVIYIAFGSFAILDQIQFNELAQGLTLSNMPFLWVDRPGFTDDGPGHRYPNGFPGSKGKIIDWAPQQKVLSHPSIACFLSHCGWNSVLEGISNGVPFLCWPYFADQHMNQDYICDVWKVGMKFERDENDVVTREEVEKKVKKLLDDEGVKMRSLEMKNIGVDNVAEGGRSSKNFNDFIEWLET